MSSIENYETLEDISGEKGEVTPYDSKGIKDKIQQINDLEREIKQGVWGLDEGVKHQITNEIMANLTGFGIMGELSTANRTLIRGIIKEVLENNGAIGEDEIFEIEEVIERVETGETAETAEEPMSDEKKGIIDEVCQAKVRQVVESILINHGLILNMEDIYDFKSSLEKPLRELKENGELEGKSYEDIYVLFTDIILFELHKKNIDIEDIKPGIQYGIINIVNELLIDYGVPGEADKNVFYYD